MEKIKWNQQDTNLFEGFYESSLYHDDMLYSMSENAEQEMDFVEGGWENFQLEVCKKCVDNIMNLMADNNAIKDITFVELNSPRYYNYSTDKLICEVECDMDAIRKYCYETERDAFNKYLQDNYTSCSGFVSFVENSVEGFKQKEDTDVLLDFYILNHLESGLGESGAERLADYNANDAYETLFAFVEPVEKN